MLTKCDRRYSSVKNKKFSRLALTTAISLIVFESNTALAQSSTTQALEEVFVTAQKRQQSTQDVPAAITALSSDFLEKTATKNFSDISQITSGISIGGDSDGFAKQIRIRGVGTNSQTPSIRPAVGIFLDEIPLVEPAVAYNNLADIERIEILKGPQATLFGKEVSAGAISLFSKRPHTDGIDGYVEGNFGNLGLGEGRAGINLPLADSLALRASIYHREKDNAIETPKADGIDADGLRLRLLWKPTDELNIIFGHEYHETEVTGASSVPLEYGDLITTYAQIYNNNPVLTGLYGPIDTTIGDPFARSTNNESGQLGRDTLTEVSSINIEYELTDEWLFSSISSLQNWNQANDKGAILRADALTELGATTIPPGSSDTARSPFLLGPFVNEYYLDSKTQEFRFTYEGEKLASILGAFYADSEDGNITPVAFATAVIPSALPGVGVTPVVVRNETLVSNITETKEWAVFSHNTYNFTDALEFTFGLRYSEVKKTTTAGQQLGPGTTIYADLHTLPTLSSQWDVPVQEDTWSAITGTLKLNYYLTEDVSVYAGYDRGFKAGGHNTAKDVIGIVDVGGGNFLPVSQGVRVSDPFDEEYADNLEVGFKSYFFDRSLRWNGSVFYQMYSDYQVDIQDSDSIGNTIQNAAEAIITGFETDIQWIATENLMFDATLSYVDARWDSYKNASCIRPQFAAVACPVGAGGGVQDLTNKRINSNSPWTANFNTTWDDTFSNGMAWYIRGEVAFRDDLIFSPDLDPATKQSSYMMFNASFSVSTEDGDIQAILWGKNLTDEKYYTLIEGNRDGSSPNPMAPPPSEGLRANLGEERSYGVTLKYNF